MGVGLGVALDVGVGVCLGVGPEDAEPVLVRPESAPPGGATGAA
ncbi:hypothetical protein STRTUCAR8_05779 [Streptomyces turgidiscabies Car8]|uniref:Uncharacterized protein n=1 Tax=Streptomyces turgidiscabies (strain Car8) TaxID=698760 RepID=L7F8H4_STRT8|nr:hypothetical protein STRTUCAR8_05779 [Streptomyces turgidiscabies Car8]